MIRTTDRSAVTRLIEDILTRPGAFARIVFCSPTIDDRMQQQIVAMAQAIKSSSCTLKIITRPDTARELRAALGRNLVHRASVRSSRCLHAKAYLAIAKEYKTSKAIVTSANLTTAALTHSIEFGVCTTATTDSGRRLLSEVVNFLDRIEASSSQTPPRTLSQGGTRNG